VFQKFTNWIKGCYLHQSNWIKVIILKYGGYQYFIEKLLLETKKNQAENRRKCKNAYSKEYTDYICVDDLGVLLKPDFLSRHLQIILKKNNLKHIRYHDLRHSCASLLIANGISLKEIQDWLGHSDYGTTVNIKYPHKFKVTVKAAWCMYFNLQGYFLCRFLKS